MNKILRTIVLASVIGAPVHAEAAVIVFDFESTPDSAGTNGQNPVFSAGGLTITHSSTLPSTSQWSNDTVSSVSVPHGGTGSMRLSLADIGDRAVSARLDFSSVVDTVSLWGFDADTIAHRFTISALSNTDAILASVQVANSGAYELVEFSGVGPIGALTFAANAINVAYWDDLTVTTAAVPEPGILTLLGLGLAGFAGRRRVRRWAGQGPRAVGHEWSHLA